MQDKRRLFEISLDGTMYTVLATQLSNAIQEVLSHHSLDYDDESLSCNLINGDDKKILDDEDGSEHTLTDWIKKNINVSNNTVIIGSTQDY